MRSLEGQTAIVTAGGAGIGRGIACVLAAEGASVVVVDVDAERAAATAATIDERAGSARAVAADVSDAAEVERLIAEATAWTGRVDVLASNVGIYPTSALEAMSEESWDRVMTVNAKSAFLLLRGVLPIMRAQRYGRVVVTSSITGPITAMPALGHYGASKAALVGLVRAAALEAAADGVTVNAVLPGTVDTEGLRSAGGEEYVDLMLPSIPLGRLGLPEDLGWVVRMLAAPEAAYVTGAAVVVDGGQTLPEGRIESGALDAMLAAGA